LAVQSYPSEKYEAVVVDDGSTDETFAVADQEFPFELKYIHQHNRGAAVARNRGAQKSHGDILIFIDDDITLEKDYITGLAEAHANYDKIIGMGACYPDPSEHDSLFAQVYANRATLRIDENRDEFVSFADCVTNNLSVEREAFFNIGMMQDVAGDGPTWWGDVDFGYRAYQADYRFRRSGKAVCYHRDYSIRDLNTACQRAKDVYRMAPLLFRKYPDLQSHLRVFQDKTSISFLEDSPVLVTNKLFHIVTAWPPVQSGIKQLAKMLEHVAPQPALLWVLYRWIISSYIYRGYQEGLRKYGPISDSEECIT
jgi:glycosyltransferase involved in cell wall biosynthesis